MGVGSSTVLDFVLYQRGAIRDRRRGTIKKRKRMTERGRLLRCVYNTPASTAPIRNGKQTAALLIALLQCSSIPKCSRQYPSRWREASIHIPTDQLCSFRCWSKMHRHFEKSPIKCCHQSLHSVLCNFHHVQCTTILIESNFCS